MISTTAMPAVNPVVTGCGISCINRPNRTSPIATSITPAIIPATSSPLSPYFETIGTRMTTNAAVGPVTWNCVPPSSAQITPAMIAV